MARMKALELSELVQDQAVRVDLDGVKVECVHGVVAHATFACSDRCMRMMDGPCPYPMK